jgi:hypothetical protein
MAANLSALRATKMRLIFDFAMTLANSSPIPEEAPVTNAVGWCTLFFILIYNLNTFF